MKGYFTHSGVEKKKWFWIMMVILAVGLIVFIMYKKRVKRKSDTDSCDCDYLTTGNECIACCGDINQDNHTFKNE